MTKLIRTALIGVALATSALAFGQSASPPGPPSEGGAADFAKVREACHDDVERLCKDVKPGDGRLRECLRAHKDELSAGCQAAIREARAHHHPHPNGN
jgi:Cysteine rich repeat